MDLHKHLLVILLACLISSCYAYEFYVGGRAGWVPNPSENYNHWAERMRFQVNDTLVFKYKKGSNSVVVVNKDDYDKCNTNNPIKKMDDGNSIFKFDHSGPFFFISGNKDDCENGSQKLIVVVLAIRPPPPSPTTPPSTPGKSPATPPVVSPAASPVSQTPTSSPSNSPSPADSPENAPSPAMSPENAPSPAMSPSGSPGNAPSPAISPAGSPENAPTPATSPASTSPASSPSGAIISPSPSSGSSSSPSLSPPGSPGSVAPAAGGGGNSPPADIQSPTGSKNSAVKAFTTATTVLVSIILTIIIVSA